MLHTGSRARAVVSASRIVVRAGRTGCDLERGNAPRSLDLAIIDVDGQDYWLFNSLLKHRPQVVMVEYDPNAPVDFVPPINGEGQAGKRRSLTLASENCIGQSQ